MAFNRTNRGEWKGPPEFKMRLKGEGGIDREVRRKTFVMDPTRNKKKKEKRKENLDESASHWHDPNRRGRGTYCMYPSKKNYLLYEDPGNLKQRLEATESTVEQSGGTQRSGLVPVKGKAKKGGHPVQSARKAAE